MTDPCSTPVGFRLTVRDPQLTKDAKSVQFILAVELEGGRELLHVRGFRVSEGRIRPPARLQGRAWLPIAKWGEGDEPEVYIRQLVRPWASEFPQVEF